MALSVKLDAGQSRALALSLLGHCCGTTPPLGLLHEPHRRGVRAAEALCMATGGPKPTPAGRHLAQTLSFSFTVATIQ
ncbi:hypothetical protein BC835DRAFT_1413523 [Cytidiella melzeri]|nr:hypothetical protein BC835DRAFT_1413523 [Cytidiella melzeri]